MESKALLATDEAEIKALTINSALAEGERATRNTIRMMTINR